ncbi:DUF6984 family protein [Rhizobium ruizarguesonis]|uniref:DUF6984 family protein n=1 Tax=Rhizobium ruizarguesonis TaxID=2081791 RepID=UPI0037C8B081
MSHIRDLTSHEQEIIRSLLSGAQSTRGYRELDISRYRAKTIDDFGSLELIPRDLKIDTSLPRHPLVSAYFSDENRPEPGALVNIILFSRDTILSELQIYKSDGSPLQREIVPREIYF